MISSVDISRPECCRSINFRSVPRLLRAPPSSYHWGSQHNHISRCVRAARPCTHSVHLTVLQWVNDGNRRRRHNIMQSEPCGSGGEQRDPSNSCRNGTDEAIIARDIATVALSVVLICVTHEVASRLAGLLAGGTFTTAGEWTSKREATVGKSHLTSHTRLTSPTQTPYVLFYISCLSPCCQPVTLIVE